MNPETYREVKQIFLEVRRFPPQERSAFLDGACKNQEIRRRVEKLLDADDDPLSNPEAETSQHAPGSPSVLPAHPPMEEPPTRIGPYRILRPLGHGGMGVVYLAVKDDDRVKRKVALKVVKRGTDTHEVLHRFNLEQQVLSALTHEGIARLYHADSTEDGRPYFAMEYIEGQRIDRYCETRKLNVAERLELFTKVCAAVHYAHQNLVVHRDLKPSNILITPDGQPKLLDFGIAKLLNPNLSPLASDYTAPDRRVMTPRYASPEQARGDPVNTVSDVYSLGVLLYELLTGHSPYPLRSGVHKEIERIICEVDPERPSTAISRVETVAVDTEDATPGELQSITPESVSASREGRPDRLRRRLAGDIDNIVLKAMRKEIQHRYQSAEQFAEDIKRHLDGQPVIARPSRWTYRCGKFIRRNRGGVAAAAVIVLLLAGFLADRAWALRTTRAAWASESEQREIAEQRFDQVRALARTFMFDFHDEIQTLDGSLPARELLVTTALTYLDGLQQGPDDNPELLREIASAYDRVGDLQGGTRNPSLGDTTAALESYRTALTMRKTLAAESPDDPALMREVSTSHLKMADVLMRRGDVTTAMRSTQDALSIRQELADADPENVNAQRGVNIATLRLGDLQSRLGRHADALESYTSTLESARAIANGPHAETRFTRDLALIHSRIGGRLDDLGDHEGAAEHYRESLTIREALLEDASDTARAKRDVAWAHHFLGRAYLYLDRPDDALPHLESSQENLRQRAEKSPTDAREQRNFAIATDLVGAALASKGDLDAADDVYRQVHDIIMPLSKADPENTRLRRLLANNHERFGDVAEATDEPQRAAKQYRRALTIINELVALDPDDFDWKTERARLHQKLGHVLLASDQRDEARIELDAAHDAYAVLLELEPQLAEVRHGHAATLLDLAVLAIGDGEPPLAVSNAEEAIEVLDTGEFALPAPDLRGQLDDILEQHR